MAIVAEDLHGVLLIRDCLGADGAFVLAHILKLALGLDGHHAVVLVAARHTAPHYAQVLRKEGVSMAKAVEGGRLAVVDALRPPPGQAAQPTSLRALHTRIYRATGMLQSGWPLLLAIDDLTALQCGAADPEEWPAFLHACVARGREDGSGACTAALVHGDVDADGRWLVRLEHASSTVVDVGALETGHSAEVRGRAAICRRQLPPEVGGEPSGEEGRPLGPVHCYYSVGEGGIRFLHHVGL